MMNLANPKDTLSNATFTLNTVKSILTVAHKGVYTQFNITSPDEWNSMLIDGVLYDFHIIFDESWTLEVYGLLNKLGDGTFTIDYNSSLLTELVVYSY